jgi:ubiquitin carboxyl-terminal hydrolase 10
MIQGGQQEDAEEFLGFYLDTLEEELLSMIKSSGPVSNSTSVAVGAPIEDHADHERTADGWVEVGKKNKTIVTRTVWCFATPDSRYQ